jgi:Lrp/AsnC family transcriptional regulator, regulator for asnA, asnC and gidA
LKIVVIIKYLPDYCSAFCKADKFKENLQQTCWPLSPKLINLKPGYSMSKGIELDRLDRQILSMLMRDAKMPYTEIAERLHVSGGTIHVRMKKLIEAGVVKSHNLVVDHAKLGYDISAYLGIYLDKSSLYDEVAKELERIPEVVEAHYTTGLYNIFVRVFCKDTNHLRDVLHDKIQKIMGIQRTETFISLQESINRPLDIVEEGDFVNGEPASPYYVHGKSAFAE